MRPPGWSMLLAAVSAAGGSGIRVRDPEKNLRTNHTTREKNSSSATHGPKLSRVRDVAGDDVEPGLAEGERERGREKRRRDHKEKEKLTRRRSEPCQRKPGGAAGRRSTCSGLGPEDGSRADARWSMRDEHALQSGFKVA